MFLSAVNKNNLALIYDIGNASVGAALAVFSEKEKPRIVYAARKDVSLPEKSAPQKLEIETGKCLESVSEDIEKNGLSHLKFTGLGSTIPESAFCILSSPWHVSQTRIVTLKKDKPFLVTKKLVNELVLEEVNNFKKSPAVKEKADSGKNVLVESEIVQVKLNGYETKSPEGKSAVSLQISLFLSLAPESVINLFGEKIKKVFNLEKIFFNSFPLASFSAIRKSTGRQNFIFADISGETTDVLLAKDGTLSEIVTFPVGKKSVVRELSSKLGTSYEEALSLFYLYQEKRLSDEEDKKLDAILSESAKSWLEPFRNALIEIGDGFSLPSFVFFTSDKDAEKWFGSLIKKEDYSQFTLTESAFSLKPTDLALFGEHCRLDGNVKRDNFLAIGAIFADKK